MKKVILSTLAVLVQLTSGFSQNMDVFNQKINYLSHLKGRWTISDWTERDKKISISEQGMLIFGDNNKVTAINGRDTLYGTFLYNDQKSPHWIDFNWKSSTGQTGQSYGILEWMDFETLRIYTKTSSKERPVSFEDDPDLDQSGILRKQEDQISYLNDPLTSGKWDISLLWNAEVDHSSDKKYQTITFLPDNRYRLDGTDFIPGSSSQGRYDLNTMEVPNWIDFYSDEGTIILGLVQEYLHGYKLQIFEEGHTVRMVERSRSASGHPLQFSDVEFGAPDAIRLNPNFLFLQRSGDSVESKKVKENPVKTDAVVEVPFSGTSRPGEVITDLEGNTYRTIVLGNGQQWMAENLKYLPEVSGPGIGSPSAPHYYVYGYNGSSVQEAKATWNYQTYGVLYNWPAAMAGAESSASIPSGVQGVCPKGWHLPSFAEWTAMEEFLIARGCNFDGSTVDNKLAKAMSSSSGWIPYTKEGAPGNKDFPQKANETGFTALPGGFRDSGAGVFSDDRSMGLWWSATENSSTSSIYSMIIFSRIGFSLVSFKKESGYSVRCVKD